MKDITLLKIIHKMKISFSSPISFKIAYLAENVRLEGPKKQAIVSCSRPEKQAMSLLLWAEKTGNESPVVKASNSNCSCPFGRHLDYQNLCFKDPSFLYALHMNISTVAQS